MEKKNPILSIIVAVAENGVIGKNNEIPWQLPMDMKFFKETTMGHHMVTGRKNYESIGRPLPGRTMVIATRDSEFTAPGSLLADSIEEAIQLAMELEKEEVFIIGGGEIYRQTLHLVDRLYITKIHESFDGDVFFPQINESQWKEVRSQLILADEKHKYSFTFYVYERIK